ncbi:YdeI/OmpD-associated family protein [Actinomadura bangladeshensis]|uniref:OmdA domain containing protein n=1 Tax=Actinomadura bangladeshensis TaxID=453573 RepID=A0A6L9QMX0_9ACTN|nr:YdeI/OmpD-associated family protein [Actinomadura bangladeshensis]NEA26053.1 OmdA domain containing protein [Actinomadura bangladeshensis]
MLHFRDGAEWDAWLAAHHDTEDDAWLKIAKKGAPVACITIGEAGEVALCHGWIDSQRKGLDEHFYLQRYSRRRKGSPWSRINVERAEALIAAGRMRPSGMAEIDAARTDGRWAAAYAGQRDAAVPPDLAAALSAHPEAAARFKQLGKTDRYLLILPLLKAHTPTTRKARLDKAIATLLAT